MKKLLLPLLFLLFFLSCSKDKETVPVIPGTPLIKTVSVDTNLLASYWYDNQGRLTCGTGSFDNDSILYIYGNNTIERKWYSNGLLIQTDHGIMENGRIISMEGIKSDSGSFWSTYYTYDENGYLIRAVYMNNDTIETGRTEYTISNGNVVSISQNEFIPITINTEYYPETTNSLGFLMQEPNMGTYSKNLKKSELMITLMGSVQRNYSYEYYDNGWVKDMTMIIATDTMVLHIEYW